MPYEVKFNAETYKEEIISGTEKEIKKYNFYKKLWKNRDKIFYTILAIQILSICVPILFDNIIKIYYLIPIALVVYFNFLLYFAMRFNYPGDHPMMNFIKKELFIKGKYMRVLQYSRRGGWFSPEFGYYKGYDEKWDAYILDVFGEEKAYKFHEIQPLIVYENRDE